jgi:hypothetical protein
VLLLARIPAVRLALLGSGFDKDQRGIVTVSLPRGMAAGVLATLPFTKGVPGTDTLPVMVFAAVFMSILIFAVGFYTAKKKMTPVPGAAPLPVPAGAAPPPTNLRPQPSVSGQTSGPGATLPLSPTPGGSAPDDQGRGPGG